MAEEKEKSASSADAPERRKKEPEKKEAEEKPVSASKEATADKEEPERKKEIEKKEEKEEPEKEEEAEEPIEVPKHLEKLVEEIENLKVIDLATLVKVLEKKFGVSAVAPVAAVSAAPAAGAPAAEEKKFFDVLLAEVGDKKIEVIKAVRDITQRGLKDSKDLVDKSAEGPQVIMEKAKAEEAEEIKKKLEEAGATIELK